MQFEFDVWWKVKCHLHLSQAVEGEEGMSLYQCDTVALGNLTVAQRNCSTSVNRLTRAWKQITLETSQMKLANMELLVKQILRATQVVDFFPYLLFNALLLENRTELIDINIKIPPTTVHTSGSLRTYASPHVWKGSKHTSQMHLGQED